jgi:phage shock protein C
MQPRLMRSRTESIIAGVCGGLGDYFGVDPVIVRLIFVLLTLTTGLGLLVYPVLWLAMPKMPPLPSYPPYPPYPDETARLLSAEERTAAQSQASPYVMQEARGRAQQSASRTGLPPEAYVFDPHTGQPIHREPPATGSTTMLDDSVLNQHPLSQIGPGAGPYARPPRSRTRRWGIVGVVLLGIGILALADAFGINTDFVFPILLIVGGIALLRRS